MLSQRLESRSPVTTMDNVLRRFNLKKKKVQPGWNTWVEILHQTNSRYKKALDESELEILEIFLKSTESKVSNWLLRIHGYGHKFKYRSRIWTYLNREEEYNFATACHEAGHVVSHWFTDGPDEVSCATIISDGQGIDGQVSYYSNYNDMSKATQLFSEMCCFIGGIIGQQMLAHRKAITLTPPHGSTHDFVILALRCLHLAQITVEESSGKDIEELMSFFLHWCYVVTFDILKEHRKDLKALSYALFAERELDRWQIHEIIGRRPRREKSLYEELVVDNISSGQVKEIEEFYTDDSLRPSNVDEENVLQENSLLNESEFSFSTYL